MPIVTISIALGAHSAEKQGSHQTTLTIIAAKLLIEQAVINIKMGRENEDSSMASVVVDAIHNGECGMFQDR
jgi:hypothetical protein